jgi:hypothetical protein
MKGEERMSAKTASTGSGRLILCGWDEVMVWKVGRALDAQPKTVWRWRATDREDLPREWWERFRTTDECKPVEGGRKVLITSSAGACALVERKAGKVLFYGRAANAHSADVLPNGRVAVAVSHSSDGTGDRLILYDLARPDAELFSMELPWGHGVVWDAEREKLYALAHEDIRVYSLEDWESSKPRLEQLGIVALPENGAHDLHPVPGTPMLSVTTKTHCWFFDRDTHRISPHPLLGDLPHVKSICHHPQTGQVVYIQATEPDCWWSEEVRFFNPQRTIRVPGARFYKARWDVEKG